MTVLLLAAHSSRSVGRAAVAELRHAPPRHVLTDDERARLLALIDDFPRDVARDRGAWRPLTELWQALKPPSSGYYCYLRVRGMEHVALDGMRAVIATTPWGRGA